MGGRYYETFNPPFFLDLSYRFDAIKANPYGYSRPSEDILADLKKGLQLLRPIKTPSLKIEVKDQEVTLSGSVATARIAQFIAAVAANTLGVRHTINNIKITRSGATDARKFDSKNSRKNITDWAPLPTEDNPNEDFSHF